jgi:hypothetical protein
MESPTQPTTLSFNAASHRNSQQEIGMEAQDNKQLALQKAISSHEQAAAGLSDLMGVLLSEEKYKIMLSRLTQNIVELQAEAASSKPGDHV